MYIQCTKKLLSHIKAPHGRLPNPPDPIFCWHANYFEDGGTTFVVMIHDQSAKELIFAIDSFADFAKTIEKEMRLDMDDAGASKRNVDSYFKEAGPFIFGPTDHMRVGSLNGLTRRMKSLVTTLHQMGGMIEEEQHKPKTVKQELPSGGNESIEMVSLTVELPLADGKKVVRKFLVPLHISFGALHLIIQMGFGWYDCHLHEFSLNKRLVTIGPNLEAMGLEPFDESLDEQETFLSEFIPSTRRIEYLYDFGDGWEHIIKVGKVTTITGEPTVTCTGGSGSTPPEDCGGIYGYEELCETLSDPSCDDYEEMLDWAGDEFDRGFDQDAINEQLGMLKFVPTTE